MKKYLIAALGTLALTSQVFAAKIVCKDFTIDTYPGNIGSKIYETKSYFSDSYLITNYEVIDDDYVVESYLKFGGNGGGTSTLTVEYSLQDIGQNPGNFIMITSTNPNVSQSCRIN